MFDYCRAHNTHKLHSIHFSVKYLACNAGLRRKLLEQLEIPEYTLLNVLKRFYPFDGKIDELIKNEFKLVWLTSTK